MAPPYQASDIPLRRKLRDTVVHVFPVAAIVFVVTGLIFLGIATPTESAALGVVCALVLARIYGPLDWKMVRLSLHSTMITSLMVLMILSGSSGFAQLMAYTGASQGIVELATSTDFSPTWVVVSMQLVLLLLGTFMESLAMILLTVPIYFPDHRGAASLPDLVRRDHAVEHGDCRDLSALRLRPVRDESRCAGGDDHDGRLQGLRADHGFEYDRHVHHDFLSIGRACSCRPSRPSNDAPSGAHRHRCGRYVHRCDPDRWRHRPNILSQGIHHAGGPFAGRDRGDRDRDRRSRGSRAASVRDIVHGSTTGTNALIERTGARTGLLTTAGFRDVLEIGRVMRPMEGIYDMSVDRPPPLVPRRRCLEAIERVGPRGEIIVPLDVASVERAAESFARQEVEAVAICFLFSFLNPDHERRAAEILARRLQGVAISQSHRISPEYREYERASTAVINAYLSPVMTDYLDRLERAHRNLLGDARLFVIQANGGATTVENRAFAARSRR